MSVRSWPLPGKVVLTTSLSLLTAGAGAGAGICFWQTVQKEAVCDEANKQFNTLLDTGKDVDGCTIPLSKTFGNAGHIEFIPSGGRNFVSPKLSALKPHLSEADYKILVDSQESYVNADHAAACFLFGGLALTLVTLLVALSLLASSQAMYPHEEAGIARHDT